MAQTTAPPEHAAGLVASTTEPSMGSVDPPPGHQPLPQQQVATPQRVLIDVSSRINAVASHGSWFAAS
ncbi:hypothetical protein ABZ511_27705 [Nocardia gamkensis]|uniref:hypothetical protein n=1 Tax=Nocardia gamkensis TaxID=352869 RepID=UPI0033C2618A